MLELVPSHSGRHDTLILHLRTLFICDLNPLSCLNGDVFYVRSFSDLFLILLSVYDVFFPSDKWYMSSRLVGGQHWKGYFLVVIIAALRHYQNILKDFLCFSRWGFREIRSMLGAFLIFSFTPCDDDRLLKRHRQRLECNLTSLRMTWSDDDFCSSFECKSLHGWWLRDFEIVNQHKSRFYDLTLCAV